MNLLRQVLVGLILLSEIFGNYWKILSGCETRLKYSDRFLKGDFCFRKFSEIIGNFRKLLGNIVRVRDDESLQTGSCRVNFVFGNFRKFLEIIGKYCWSAKR